MIHTDFEILPHTADIKVRVYGADLKQLYRNALNAMFQSTEPIVPSCAVEHGRVVCAQLPIIRSVVVTAPDREALLVDFLSEALYFSDVHNEAYFDADIDLLTDTKIKAEIKGVGITGYHRSEIKAVTYHDLHIMSVDGRWHVDIVFDI